MIDWLAVGFWVLITLVYLTITAVLWFLDVYWLRLVMFALWALVVSLIAAGLVRRWWRR